MERLKRRAKNAQHFKRPVICDVSQPKEYHVSLRSYTILRREIRGLKEFYGVTLSSYQLTQDTLSTSPLSKNDFDKYLKLNGVTWKKSLKRIRRQTAKQATEAMLRELILVRVISALETFLVDAIRDVFVVTKAPFMDKSIRIDLSQEDLIANNSPAKIFNRIINKETRKLTSGGFNDLIKYYKKRFEIDLSSIPPGYKIMNEYHDRRHILVHRLGQTDETYRNKYRTETQKLQVDSNYIADLLRDIDMFAKNLESQVKNIILESTSNESMYNAKLVVDIDFLQQDTPECLLPNYQYWADDEYVVMSDILLGTNPSEDGGVRYYFNGTDRALRRLRSYLRREHKRATISIATVVDRVFTKKTKNIPEEKVLLVKEQLPAQPWPKGIHKIIATNLGLSNSVTSSAIDILISRGVFRDQVDGEVINNG